MNGIEKMLGLIRMTRNDNSALLYLKPYYQNTLISECYTMLKPPVTRIEYLRTIGVFFCCK